MHVYEEFSELRRAVGGSVSPARITGFCNERGLYIALSPEGCATILVPIKEDARAKIPAPIRLENISVDFSLDCEVFRVDGAVNRGTYTAVTCLIKESALEAYFLELLFGVMNTLNLPSSPQSIVSLITGIVELFQALRRPATRSTLGMWAELFFIANSSNPLRLIQGWHTEPNDRYDFCAEGEFLEIKASATRLRNHYFSLEQVYPPEGAKCVVTSIFVERSAIGASLGELWDKVRWHARLDGELRLKVDQVVISSLGSGWQNARDEVFNERLAKDSVAFFDMRSIAKPEKGQPKGVTEVKFRSNLEMTMALEKHRQHSMVLLDGYHREP